MFRNVQDCTCHLKLLLLPSEHGSCTLPGECNCDSDYAGTLCNIDQDVCGHQSPCANGATCNNTGDNSYHCDCAPGFTGLNCDEDIDDCASSPCKNGATCIVSQKVS